MGAHFVQMLLIEGAPDPQWVFDAYVSLAEMPTGQRPAQAVVDIAWGVVKTCRLNTAPDEEQTRSPTCERQNFQRPDVAMCPCLAVRINQRTILIFLQKITF